MSVKASSAAGVAGRRASKAQQKAMRPKAEESKIGGSGLATGLGNNEAMAKNEKFAKGGKKNANKNNVT